LEIIIDLPIGFPINNIISLRQPFLGQSTRLCGNRHTEKKNVCLGIQAVNRQGAGVFRNERGSEQHNSIIGVLRAVANGWVVEQINFFQQEITE